MCKYLPRPPQAKAIDLNIDNLDRACTATNIMATFDVEHPILGTAYDVWKRGAFEAVYLYPSNLH